MSLDAERLIELFAGRTDVYAEQQESGAYFPVLAPLTGEVVDEHLAGFASYGSYVVDPTPQCVRFVMFDLDTHDTGATSALCQLVEDMVKAAWGWDAWATPPDLPCLLKEASGNKGTHVWLLFDGPVLAARVRQWVARDFEPRWRDLGYKMLEVFPKQDAVEVGGFGNLVKLPLGCHRVSGNFSEFLPQGSWAISVDTVEGFPVALIPVIEPDADRRQVKAGGRPPRDKSTPSTPFACVDELLEHGAPKGCRDLALFHLAMFFYGHGLDEDLAQEMCMRANEKFDPPMKESEVRTKVTSAYKGRHQSASCGTGWLEDFCPGRQDGRCKTGWQVRQLEGGTLRRALVGDTVSVEVITKEYAEGKTRFRVGHPDAENAPVLVVRPKEPE